MNSSLRSTPRNLLTAILVGSVALLASGARAQEAAGPTPGAGRFAQWLSHLKPGWLPHVDPRARLRGMDWRSVRDAVSPSRMVATARTNYREGRYYATDLTVHDTWQQALQRSVRPTDLGANVRSAVLKGVHPARILGNLFDPLTIELQRQIVGGEGLSATRLLRSLNPVVIGTTMAGSVAGDVAGAAVQSVLAGMGPVGAAAGFLARPLIGFSAQLFSYNMGQSLASGKSLKQGMAQALRDVRPGRDLGQLFGGVLGGVVGQVLIPIPVVGGILGGMVGGVAGMMLGNLLENHGPASGLAGWIKGKLSRLADRIEGKTANAQSPTTTPAGAERPVIRAPSTPPRTAAPPPGPLAARPTSQTAGPPPPGDMPGFEDLPVRD